MEGVPLNYRIGDLTLKMIGPYSSPMMKTMGSETRALLPWANGYDTRTGAHDTWHPEVWQPNGVCHIS